MRFDLAFVLVDLGDPFYKQAASEMIRSARRAYRGHDMRVVQLSDRKTAHCPDADIIMAMDTDVTKEQMCQFKGVAIAEHALRAETPVIFSDVDLLWNDAGLTECFDAEPVVMLRRGNMPSMPFNSGVIITHGRHEFWEHYRDAMDNMPAEAAGWYGDQFGLLAAALKTQRYKDWGCLDMDKTAPAIETLPSKPLTTPAVHFKGNRKSLMLPYARMLDGGEGFEFARPSRLHPGASMQDRIWADEFPRAPGDGTACGYPTAAGSTKLYIKDGFTF